eukprot:UN23829
MKSKSRVIRDFPRKTTSVDLDIEMPKTSFEDIMVRRVVTNFLLTQRSSVAGPRRHHKVRRKFSRGF